jgi:hypothetical protein
MQQRLIRSYAFPVSHRERPHCAQQRSFHIHELRRLLEPPFVIITKRQALLARFRSAQIRGFN